VACLAWALASGFRLPGAARATLPGRRRSPPHERGTGIALHWLDVLLSSRFGPPVAEVRTSEDFANIRGGRLDALLAKFER
jgi:hypothetical protein